MAKIVTGAEIDVQITGQQSVKELNIQLERAKENLTDIGIAYGENSTQYADAAKKLQTLEGAYDNVNTEVKELGDKNLKKVTNETKNLKNGFDAVGNAGQVLESVGGDVGKVGSAMKGASEKANLFSDKLNLLGNFKTQILNLAKVFKVNVVRSVGMARVAVIGLMSALGIGLLIAGLAVVVQYWDDIVEFMGLGATEAEKLAKATEKRAEATQKSLDDHNGMTNQLKLQGLSEKQILDMTIEKAAINLKAAMEAAQAAQASRREEFAKTQRLKKNFAEILKWLTLPVKALLLPIEGALKLFGKPSLFKKMDAAVSNIVFDPNKIDKEGEEAAAAAQKNIDKLKEQQAGYLLKRQSMVKAASDKAKKIRDKNAADAAAAQKKIDDAKLAAQEEAEQKAFNIAAKAARTKKERETDEFELRLQDAEAKFIKEKKLLEDQGLETKTLQQNFDAEITQIAIDKNDKLNKIEADAAAKRAAADKAAADADLKQKKDLADAKIEIEQNAFKAAQAFSGLMAEIGKDNLETQKAQALFQVGIDTASAISSVVNSSAALAGNPVALGFNIAAGIAIVLRNMKKATSILNAQVPVPGGDNGGGGGNNDNPQPDIQANPRDNRVFVLETDITTAQQRINNLNKIGIID